MWKLIPYKLAIKKKKLNKLKFDLDKWGERFIKQDPKI